jgi:hypothetical protein
MLKSIISKEITKTILDLYLLGCDGIFYHCVCIWLCDVSRV